MRYVPSLSLTALLLSTLTAHASSDVQVPPLPQGWVAVQAPALHGSFLHGGQAGQLSAGMPSRSRLQAGQHRH